MRTLSKYLVLLWIISLAVYGCQSKSGSGETQTQPTTTFKNITVEEAHQLIQQDPNVLVIDVRTPPEFTGPLGHIPGAELKPLQEIQNWAKEVKNFKDKKIVVVCRSGHRSRQAAEYLAKLGVKNLYNVLGGMKAWNAKGFEVQK